MKLLTAPVQVDVLFQRDGSPLIDVAFGVGEFKTLVHIIVGVTLQTAVVGDICNSYK